jgi:hypothetical protein
MGDVLEDATMVNDEVHDIVLKIGYLNQYENEVLDEYLKQFDLVVVGDGSLNIVPYLIQKMFKLKTNKMPILKILNREWESIEEKIRF